VVIKNREKREKEKKNTLKKRPCPFFQVDNFAVNKREGDEEKEKMSSG
jgi:hypothetical protein